MVLDSADQRGDFAGGAQNRIDQIRCGGFAIRAGDAGEGDALVRVAIEIAGGQRQRLAAVFDFNPGCRKAIRGGEFAGYRQRPPAHRILRELAAIGAAARKSEE